MNKNKMSVENNDKVANYKYNCEKCNFKTNTKMQWDSHIVTEKHLLGQRKKRSDYKEPLKCEKCEYKTKNKTTLLQHELNEHVSLKEREEKFKYYCKNCDFGTFSIDLMNTHNNTNKHKKYILRTQ
jgi:hypothetical protein